VERQTIASEIPKEVEIKPLQMLKEINFSTKLFAAPGVQMDKIWLSELYLG